MSKRSYKLQGFIVWQMVLGVLMLVILMAACIVNAPSFVNLGRHDKALNDTASLCGLISQYEMEVGSYPSSLSDLTGKKGQYGPWIKDIPKDPYKKNSNYQYQSQKDGFVVFSVGEDGSSSSSVSNGIKGDDIGYVSH